ncbi:MAG: phosphoglucosamine mutase [Pseudomonadota bacterium]
MAKRRYFGTDGIRGRVGEHPITPDFCLRLGWAVGKVFSSNAAGKVLIGKDTRISGYMLESVLEAGLSSAGADVSLLGPMPTPAVAYLTRTLRADAGIVISASHNGYSDNGIKFFDSQGNKLADETELAIEAQIDREIVCVDSERLGRADRMPDAQGRYIEFCKATVDRSVRLKGVRVVLDCAHGATYHVAPGVFEELGADVFVIGNEPNGININDGYGSTYPQNLADKVLELRADIGIAFDGDGDRVAMVDHTGQVVDGDELLYIIARHRKETGTLGGGVVGTVMSNLGLEQALTGMGIAFERAAVGDRYVKEALSAKRWQIGGESSGHIICLDLASTGDGIVAALQVLLPMIQQGSSLADLRSGMTKLPQTMKNVSVANPGEIATSEVVARAVAAVEAELGDRGRVLLRPSGTEPVVRVMVEGEDPLEVDALCDRLVGDVKQAARKAGPQPLAASGE